MRNPIIPTLSICLLVGLGSAPDLTAQENNSGAILDACSGPEHRQFDFWLGDWQVTDTTGAHLGLKERWRDVGAGVRRDLRPREEVISNE